MKRRPVVLMILDGYGIAPDGPYNAISLADTPVMDKLRSEYPFVYGYASGEAVGLPDGQMGNSEVGHLNIGAGRIVYQELTRISKSINDGDFFENRAFLEVVENCKKHNSTFHICGLLSDGGVHSLNKHMYALLKLAKDNGLDKVYVHAFMDGRDTPPDSGKGYMEELLSEIDKIGTGRVATVSGRYYAMDRDNRWERVSKAYEAMAEGKGVAAASAMEAVTDSLKKGVTDEFIVPAVIMENGRPLATVEENDTVCFINCRPDRARELTRAFCDDDFTGFDRGPRKKIKFVCMVDYDVTIKNKLVAFEKEKIRNTFGEYIASLGMKQLRIAETEKYAHVTFFFNGGIEEPYPGEKRILIPSPKVSTYDEQPEMSANIVCDELVKEILSEEEDVIIVNFANPDMVGHTGDISAVVSAIEAVDACVGRVYEAVKKVGGVLFICADHGNSEAMFNEQTGEPITAHTTNPVPFILVNYEEGIGLKDCKGRLCDIVPTLLDVMGLEQPEEMTGESLLLKSH